MAQVKDITLDLERHQQALEETISRLRKSLQYWQTWYFEYAALKEEVAGSEDQPPSRKDLARIRRDFDAELLDKKEVNELFGKHDLKEPEQIISALSRRMDYVERNVETIGKQLEAAQNRLAASIVVANPDGGTDEESGLPITDIIEELDKDGNVVNFRLQTGGDTGPKVLEALRKAGLDGLGDTPEASTAVPTSSEPSDPTEEDTTLQSSREDAHGTPSKNNPSLAERPASSRKSVSFVEDTKPGHDSEEQQPVSRAARRLEQIMQRAKDLETLEADSVVIPEDESQEDAELRREMLEYGLSEIGPVVAELQLDEDYSGNSDDDDEYDYTDEDDDTEDELGRSRHSVITDDYRQRMQELEKRLGVQSAFSADPMPKNPIPEEGIGRISIVGQAGSRTLSRDDAQAGDSPKPATKKGVRFAEQLDIAPGDEVPTPASSSASKETPEVNPLSDIVERTAEPRPRAENPTRRPSRFKKERGAGSESAVPHVPSGPHEAPVRFLDQDRAIAPSGPAGQTMADAIVERDVSSEAREPDEFDTDLVHQQAAVEFNRVRNRLIHKQGGFLKEHEAPITPLDEEEGGPKRMSRFKAARLSRQ
ncbi:Prefoldin subunit-domain-containing protein [Phialemonium atrogriseum]|uniref:Prefoldin subunit-domain-containing protein n=1 Tax=Phialemonium atrogriseum TaxID=1093897 RepID=A0AAJ0BZD7_9PEZI|nr:Prefoldin subunit-domain-containing protein [Phialemonium atrogriseum]KAK1764871.1 Prefoldin subunit-domain-containing protein [Phialemonium atrogriseum]